MSLVHSNAVLQALSTFTGAAVKPMTEETEAGNELNVFNFLPTTFVKQGGDEPDSLFSDLYVDMDGFLDPKFNCDFTNLKDNSACVRGGEPYTRPFGWNRIAVKVLNKYPDGNTWLGTGGWRSHSVGGEWPVSFYGTSMSSAKSIIKSHYGSVQECREGIYSTPDLKEAFQHSDIIRDDETGKTYKVLLQNRINPQKMRKVYGTLAEFWLIEVPEDTLPPKKKKIVEESIRPYGILFKEV